MRNENKILDEKTDLSRQRNKNNRMYNNRSKTRSMSLDSTSGGGGTDQYIESEEKERNNIQIQMNSASQQQQIKKNNNMIEEEHSMPYDNNGESSSLQIDQEPYISSSTAVIGAPAPAATTHSSSFTKSTNSSFSMQINNNHNERNVTLLNNDLIQNQQHHHHHNQQYHHIQQQPQHLQQQQQHSSTMITENDNNMMETNNDNNSNHQSNRTTRRAFKDAPLSKLTKDLIGTYKHINTVYYASRQKRKAQEALNNKQQECDDENGDYKYNKGEVLNNRYTIVKGIGNGSFGKVVEAVDNTDGSKVAIKIIKSKKPFFNQAKTEIKLLEELRRHDMEDKFGIVSLKSTFVWHNHQCLVFEMLSHNLYDLLHNTNFQGVSLNLVRKFAKQILRTLMFLSRPDIDVVHCDLKPENILLQSPLKAAIKIIDFGSSCKTGEQVYTYIQSRFYRSPEVILGYKYTSAIDMWSLGCIMIEMHSGDPLFSGYDEHDQMRLFTAALGMPPSEMLDRGAKTTRYFERAPQSILHDPKNQKTQWILKPNSRSDGKPLRPGRTIRQILGVDPSDLKTTPFERRAEVEGHTRQDYDVFIDLVRRMLTFDPETRIKPQDALSHPFFFPPSPLLPKKPLDAPERTQNASSSSSSTTTSNMTNATIASATTTTSSLFARESPSQSGSTTLASATLLSTTGAKVVPSASSVLAAGSPSSMSAASTDTNSSSMFVSTPAKATGENRNSLVGTGMKHRLSDDSETDISRKRRQSPMASGISSSYTDALHSTFSLQMREELLPLRNEEDAMTPPRSESAPHP